MKKLASAALLALAGLVWWAAPSFAQFYLGTPTPGFQMLYGQSAGPPLWRFFSTVNLQTGATYTPQQSDATTLILISGNSAFTAKLPTPNASTFASGWSVFFKNNGTPNATLSPLGGLINGAATFPLAQGAGIYVVSDGTNYQTWGGNGTGTVSSVGLSIPGSVFNISGSPVTSSGTLQATFNGVTPNFHFAGNPSGATLASPQFRLLVSGDLPTPNLNLLGGIYSTNAFAHNFITSINNSGTPQSAVPSVADLQTVTPHSYLGNPTGSTATPQAGTIGRTADWNQNTQNDVVMAVDQLRLSASPQFVTASTSITLNFANGMNFNTTLNSTCNPCTVVTPQGLSQTWAGSLILTQASTNSTIAFSKPIWVFPGGTAPTASVTNNDVDVLNFICVTPNAKCFGFYGGNYQ